MSDTQGRVVKPRAAGQPKMGSAIVARDRSPCPSIATEANAGKHVGQTLHNLHQVGLHVVCVGPDTYVVERVAGIIHDDCTVMRAIVSCSILNLPSLQEEQQRKPRRDLSLWTRL